MSEDNSQSRDYATEMADARRVAFDSLKALEGAAWTHGFHEGFQAGWEAGRKRFQEAMEKVTAQPDPLTASATPLANSSFFPRPTAHIRAADVVFQIIADHPGIRGVDIVKATLASGSPLLERTTRTALYRMKREERIRNVRGRWFTADAAPYGGIDSDGDENDAQT